MQADGGRGEDVTKISELSAFIPKLPGEKTELMNMEYQNVMVMPIDNTRVALPVIMNPF